MTPNRAIIVEAIITAFICFASTSAEAFQPEPTSPPEVMATETTNAFIDDTAPGWRSLNEDDFVKVNSAGDTWSWRNGVLHCTGQPLSVLRTKDMFENVEVVVQWMHEKPAGNSGLFLWTTPESIKKLTDAGEPGLPEGIEVQMLDHAFTDQMQAQGRKTDWFGTNGDVFGVGKTFDPFSPTSPNGSRSFPRKKLCNGHQQWNDYYIRAVNGEVRLWVNGEEVSGGNGVTDPRGYLCLESEGSPVQFRRLRVRELPSSETRRPNRPPEGFAALFNGKNLTGWKGVIAKGKPQPQLSEQRLKEAQEEADERMRKHWSVRDGVLMFDGEGESLSTDRDYGDFELYVDWKIEAGGDSGIYLRRCPQIQIWDPQHEPYFKFGNVAGSGAIWNNKKNPRFPPFVADNPVGQWNTFHIRMTGSVVTVDLNGRRVVDNVVMENFWDPSHPIEATGPIFLQDHGSILRFRNIFIRELDAATK